LTAEEMRALLNLLIETIEADRYRLSPRVQLLCGIIAKFGALGLPPELAARVRRYTSPPPARPPTPEERDPGRAPRLGRRRRSAGSERPSS
jgi:hypothetical protein